MSLENAKTIAQLDETWPESSDDISQGDNHLRMIKDVLKVTFPGSSGDGFNKPIEATENELNHLTGVIANIQEQLDSKGDDGAFVSKLGDTMTGDLQVHADVWVVDQGADQYYGYGLKDINGNIRAVISYDSNSSSLFIAEYSLSGNIDTLLTINDGNVVVTSPSGAGTSPKEATSLTTKEYVDSIVGGGGGGGGAFLPLTGGILTGLLTGSNEIRVRDDGGLGTPGVSFYDSADQYKGAVGYKATDGAMEIVNSDTGGPVETRVIIKDGNIAMSSDTGASVLPATPNALATKQYVDDAVIGGGGSTYVLKAGDTMTGILNVHYGVRARQNDGADLNPGFGIDDLNGNARGGLSYAASSAAISLNQVGSAGTANDTILTLSDGKARMSSASGKSVLPLSSDTSALATVAYVNNQAGGTGYLPLTGGVLTGNLEVKDNLIIKQSNAFVDQIFLRYQDSAGRTRADLHWNRDNENYELTQYFSSGVVETRFSMHDGVIGISDANFQPVDPYGDTHLCNKKYVDTFFANNIVQSSMTVNGEIITNNAIFRAKQNTAVGPYAGLVVTDQSTTNNACGFFYDYNVERTTITHIGSGSNGSPATTVQIGDNGIFQINGNQVALLSQIPALAQTDNLVSELRSELDALKLEVAALKAG